MQKIQSFKELIVWSKSIELCKDVYRLTDGLPPKETYGLTSQMRRSVVSIPLNIAEGRMRGTRKDFSHFLQIALGSCAELETQIIISREVYPNFEYSKVELLLLEIQKMLTTMINRLGS